MVQITRLLPLISLAINACFSTLSGNLVKDPNSFQWYQHQKEIRKLNQYQARGVFSYVSNKQRFYAHFFLQKRRENFYEILLINLISKIELKINLESNKIQLIDSKGHLYVFNNTEKIINDLIRLTIPINNLLQWILGLPGDSTNYILDEKYHLKEVNYTQNNNKNIQTWKVIYYNYNYKTQPVLPSEIELFGENQKIRLKTDNWIVHK